jgi:hypothetical protein
LWVGDLTTGKVMILVTMDLCLSQSTRLDQASMRTMTARLMIVLALLLLGGECRDCSESKVRSQARLYLIHQQFQLREGWVLIQFLQVRIAQSPWVRLVV